MFYRRMNIDIVQVLRSCEKIIKVVKKWIFGRNFSRRLLMAS